MADVDNIVYLDCRKHPDYQLKRKPTSSCEACWKAWLEKKSYLERKGEADYLSWKEDRYSR
jgi:hypothetical protein